MADTVSPPQKQLIGLSRFTEEEILLLYSRGSHPSLPCPTKLLREILAITRLRTRVHDGAVEPSEVQATTTAICQRILSFSPGSWVESYPLPDVPEIPLMADVFKAAVGLYAFLSLSGTEMPLQRGRDAVITGRAQLLKLVVKLWENPKCRSALNWPLAVLGCALAGGKPADQATVCNYLTYIAKDPTTTQPLNILRLLKEFWSSGKREWDECWHEPFVVIG